MFCSAWDLKYANKTQQAANVTACDQPCLAVSSGLGCGACGVPGHCYVGAWSSRDLVTWTGPSKAVELPWPYTVANIAASVLPAAVRTATDATPDQLAPHQAFMAFGYVRGFYTGDRGHQDLSVAINLGSDRDLHSGWSILNQSYVGSRAARSDHTS